MVRTKTSTKLKKFTGNGSVINWKKQPKVYNPKKNLLDDQLIAEAIWECLKDNDPDGVIEVLEAHFRAKNKLADDSELPRTTIHHSFRTKNPTLHTLAKLVHATT